MEYDQDEFVSYVKTRFPEYSVIEITNILIAFNDALAGLGLKRDDDLPASPWDMVIGGRDDLDFNQVEDVLRAESKYLKSIGAPPYKYPFSEDDDNDDNSYDYEYEDEDEDDENENNDADNNKRNNINNLVPNSDDDDSDIEEGDEDSCCCSHSD